MRESICCEGENAFSEISILWRHSFKYAKLASNSSAHESEESGPGCSLEVVRPLIPPTALQSGGTELDSDSDMEDLQHLLSQSGRAHAFIRNTLRKMALAGQEPQHQRSPSPRDKMSPPKFVSEPPRTSSRLQLTGHA